MNGKLIDLLLGKERKRYNEIIHLIDLKEYNAVFYMDEDKNFGLTNQTYINTIISRLEQEAHNNIDFIIQMKNYNYFRFNDIIEKVIETNPIIIEKLIEKGLSVSKQKILKALENGYVPDDNFINNHFEVFSNSEVMLKIIELGYRPTNEIIEANPMIYGEEKLLTKLLDLGFIPSLYFIKRTNSLNNPVLMDKILDVIELTPELVNGSSLYGSLLYGNSLAQQKIISKKPELLLSIPYNNEIFNQIWIEAFKQGYIPKEILSNHYITGNYLLFSKIIKQHPEMIKHCTLSKKEERDKLDELALSMGYIPSINEALSSDYIKRSTRLMEALISRRPEAIKYIQKRTESNAFLNISQEELQDLARLSVNNGYIPTLQDLESNSRLAESFEIMKLLIQDNPDIINMITEYTPNKEELLKVALENGFNGEIITEYKVGEKHKNELLTTETAIIYRMEQGLRLFYDGTNKISYEATNITYHDDYSINLYHYLTSKGYQIEYIINLFIGNFETMKLIISEHPEYINMIGTTTSAGFMTVQRPKFTREQIDELGLIAINNGYVPKYEDDIFGYGTEVTKVMVKLFPNYLEKVSLCSTMGPFVGEPCEGYDEICKLAVDGGFLPDIETMGNGYGNTTRRYCYSYDIMKKAIPLKPELIEVCLVKDKDQYNELCRLAISSGYKIDEYDFYHGIGGAKMPSNFDLMAIYLKTDPIFILKVDIEDSNEMLQLLDIAINSGLDLNNLSQSSLLKIFLKIDESKWSNYLDSNTIESLQKAKVLQTNNEDISETINPDFLSEKITSHFTPTQVEILSCYPQLQEKIINIVNSSHRTINYYELINSSGTNIKANIIFDLANKYKDNLEWIPILEKSLDNMNSPEFDNLLSSIETEELTEEEKENLYYLLMTDNHLDISTIEELRNIDTIRDNYIEMLIERNTLGSLKTAYLEKVFGIDLTTAINLVNLYGKSLDSTYIDSLDEQSKNELIILDNIKIIIRLNNIEVLKYYLDNINPEFVIKPDLMVTYESRLKNLFTREFNKSFTKPLEEDRVVSDIEGEKELDIYLAAGHDGTKQCRMMITSIGAYTNMEEPDDYYASWNVGKIASHGCCCSYVGEKNLGTAQVKYCCLGFTDYEPGSLQLSAPYDLCSFSKSDSYQIESYYSSMFLLPDDVLDYTRHTHNETVWERRNIGGDVSFKKQPSYIVYFVDNFEDRLTDEEAKRQWESVKKAAENFSTEVDGVKKPLPIMVVEREKIAKSQLEIIQENLSEFRRTLEPKLIKEIIVGYESNYAGNREYHPNISEKYFPQHDKLSDSVVGQIIEIINNISQTDPNKAKECLYELEKTIRGEQEKYNNTKHGVSQSLPSFSIDEALIKINELKSNLRMSRGTTITMIKNIEGNTRQFEKSDVPNIPQELLDTQLSTSAVETILTQSQLLESIDKYENEITQENVNSGLKVHGQRHIKNVLLYSSLIGQSIIKDKHDLELILIAAKYHDIGRRTDAYEPHAEASARIAIEKLKDKYREEDLSIISTIIEFHEYPRDNNNVDKLFAKIAIKNGIEENQIPRVRQMAEVLKDADALDRTRFINRARLNPKYLQFDISKQLIRFASSLQETYALQDIKEFQCESEINILLQNYTPQEILRTIRHSIRKNANQEDIQFFIRSWALSESKKATIQEMIDKQEPIMEARHYDK